MKPEDKVAASIIVSQLVMIGLVVTIVLSPSYSANFNQMLKEQSLQNYRVSGTFMRSSSTAELAKIFHKPGLGVGIEIHADEQMALEAIARRTGHVKESLSKLRHHVDAVRKQNDTTSSIANIALLKLIRVELAAADLYYTEGAYPRARALVTAATEDLKSQTSFFEEEPQRFNLERIFDLTQRINRAEGDVEGEQRAEALKAMLATPAAASEWFRTHGMKGFSGSYPSEFQIKNLLSADNKNSRASMLAQALEVCKRPGVRSSTRIFALQAAINEADGVKAPSLVKQAAAIWMKYYSRAPIEFQPDAVLAYSLKDYLVRKGTPEQRALIRSRVEETIANKLLPQNCSQTYFDSYETDQSIRKVWPPATVDVARKECAEIDRMLSLCHKRGCDDFSLQLSRLVALYLSEQIEAEKLSYQILERMRTRSPEQSKIDRIRFIHAIPGVVSVMVKPHTAESDARILRLLEKVKSNCEWEDGLKLRLLLSYYDFVPEAEKAKREKVLNEILALDRKLKWTGPQNMQFVFFVLHTIMIGQNKPDEGRKMIDEFRASCKPDDLPTVAQLNQQLLGYRRAYPSYSPETLKICKEKTFPAKYFEETPDLVAQISGKRSARYCRCLLWLSQFEFCRGNNERALQLTNQILSTPGVERMDSYLAAKDMRIQLLGEKPPRIDGEIIGAHDSILELLCLSNIYAQLHKPDAVTRIDTLRAHVREK